jgi:hypothetical protein
LDVNLSIHAVDLDGPLDILGLEWANEWRAFAAAGLMPAAFSQRLADARTAAGSGDTGPWLVLCDFAQDHGVALDLAGRTRRALAECIA